MKLRNFKSCFLGLGQHLFLCAGTITWSMLRVMCFDFRRFSGGFRKRNRMPGNFSPFRTKFRGALDQQEEFQR